jgi:hypothetical protein
VTEHSLARGQALSSQAQEAEYRLAFFLLRDHIFIPSSWNRAAGGLFHSVEHLYNFLRGSF